MSYTPLPIGVDDFEKLRKKEYYYVDKTLLIKELLDKKGEVNLFTRPRRFGKTLNLSMLKYFFELPICGGTNKELFHGLKIVSAGEKYTCEQEQYPVIFLTLKAAKQADFDLSYKKLRETIASEFYRHNNIVERIQNTQYKEKFIALRDEKAEYGDYLTSIAFLSKCLSEYYGKKTIILIDEYDVPLENAFYAGFYEKMAGFIRSLFESALKTNSSLEFAVITGCLRISKESIFTGLNNLKAISILNEEYGEHFGFVEKEVKEMLSFYGCEEKMDVMKKWYDGYLFGKSEVYNPWSVIHYTERLYTNKNAFPVPAWSNTSSNSIVKDLIYHADIVVRDEIERLNNGGTIDKPVHEDITYEDIHESKDNLWNFLLFTGYLKVVSIRMVGDERYVTMAIPNTEVASIYRNQIHNWFRDEVKVQDLSALYSSMLSGEAIIFQQELQRQLQKSISYMDSNENFYHGFLLGIFANLEDYLVRSNREVGDGRYDICVYSQNETIAPVILELKIAETFKSMERKALEALQQIFDRHYENGLSEEGFSECICFGLAFYKKKCRVQVQRIKL